MNTSHKPEFELSPLDQIRQMEAEVARQIASAREAGGRLIAKTKSEAKLIINEARQVGHREGQRRYKEIVSAAEEEAQTLVAQARRRAEFLRRRGRHRLELGISQAMNIILGLEVSREEK